MDLHPPIDNVLARLKKVKPSRNGSWTACCPAHDDRNPSLSIGTGEGGRVLLHCFSGCEVDDILTAIHLTPRDLFPDNAPQPDPPSRGRLLNTTNYLVRDYDGASFAIHVRQDFEYGKKIWWKQPNGETGLGADRNIDDLPLWGSHETQPGYGKSVFLTEGETARDALAELGVTALGTYGAEHEPGIGILLDLYEWPTIYLWPDRDRPGLLHMRKIAERLVEFGHQQVKVIIDPDAEWKDDAADFVKRGGDQEKLAALCHAAMTAQDFLDPGRPQQVVKKSLYLPDSTQVITMGNIEFHVQFPRYGSGIEATITIFHTGNPDPIATDRINLDRMEARQRFADRIGLDADDILRLRSRLIELRENSQVEIPLMADVVADWKAEREHGTISQWRTGFAAYDEIIGGFQSKQLIVVSGPTGGGKTAFMTGISQHYLTRYSLRVGFISLEMTKSEIMERLFNVHAQKALSTFMQNGRIHASHKPEFDAVLEELNAWPLFITDDLPPNLPAVLSHSRRLRNEFEIDFLVIDQIHSLRPLYDQGRTDFIGDVSHSMKHLARELDIPVLTAAQMNRNIRHRKDHHPVIDDIRDSAEIGHQADNVTFVIRKSLFKDQSKKEEDNNAEPIVNADGSEIAEFHVLKNRGGKTGNTAMLWRGELMAFDKGGRGG